MRVIGTTLEEMGAKSLPKHLLGSVAWHLEQVRLLRGGQDAVMASDQDCHSLIVMA